MKHWPFKMEKKIVQTSDGSFTLYIPEWDEHYHSKFGALEESTHLFINYGLNAVKKSSIKVLEVGFGTGLNAFLTFIEGQKRKVKIHYETIEKYPLGKEELSMLNYAEHNHGRYAELFEKLHSSPWEKEVELDNDFVLLKRNTDLLDFRTTNKYNVVYFDAFAPDLQSELWSEQIFVMLHDCMEEDGVLVTYSTKGIVRRALQSAGFMIEKIPGPEGGKKENLRAWA